MNSNYFEKRQRAQKRKEFQLRKAKLFNNFTDYCLLVYFCDIATLNKHCLVDCKHAFIFSYRFSEKNFSEYCENLAKLN